MPTLFFFSFEDGLQTTHLPEMVFGESFLSLEHTQTGIKLHFNALDALKAWKEEALPPVEVPAAAKWKFRSKPSDQVILDYDYTFTTPYCGSDAVVLNSGTVWTFNLILKFIFVPFPFTVLLVWSVDKCLLFYTNFFSRHKQV